MIASDSEQAIKDRANIIEIIGSVVALKRSGPNYTCKCPFHDENSPSFSVSPAKGIYKCFGCGVSGDAIGFIQAYLKLDYPDALKWIADFYRITVEEHAAGVAPAAAPRPHQPARPAPAPLKIAQAPVYVPADIYYRTLTEYDNNNFATFLRSIFEPCRADIALWEYRVGTSKHFPNAALFWQIDQFGNVRYGKIMGYNPETGKRIREPFSQVISFASAYAKALERAKSPAPDWLTQYDQQASKPQCLFGLHLLNADTRKPIAVVESEKTAIVASVMLPGFIWMATGQKGYEKFNKHGEINPVPDSMREKFRPLAGRRVVFFPDLGAVDDWQHLAGELSDICEITVNRLLLELGLPAKSDLCDYLTSDAARRELIDGYREAFISLAPQSVAEAWQQWEQFRNRGLRAADALQAYAEIRRDYDFDNDGFMIGRKIISAA